MKQWLKNIPKETLKAELRDYIMILCISTAFTYFFICPGCFDTVKSAISNTLYSFVIWAAFWKGNAYIASYLSTKISWVNQTLRRFSIGMLCMIVYTVLIQFLVHYLFYLAGFTSVKIAPVGAYLIAIGITVVISMVYHSIMFLQSWRKAELDMEKFKNERLASQYEALKNQVNPHFLFNSLNALTSLVYEDADQAAKFIQQLSKVYRYVLDNREKETVALAAEMEFVNSYLFLQKIRYGDNLQYRIEIPTGPNYRVAPLSVQMLVENAIKHNIISSDEPLHIRIEVEQQDYLVTRNKLQIKNIINEYSGIGLENIKARYLYFTNKPVIIEKTSQAFTVKLPLILEQRSLEDQKKDELQAV